MVEVENNDNTSIKSNDEDNTSIKEEDDNEGYVSNSEENLSTNERRLQSKFGEEGENEDEKQGRTAATTYKDEDMKEIIESFKEDPQTLITELFDKIENLENQVDGLKQKNDELLKDNIEKNSKLKKISYVGLKKKFTVGIKDDKNVQLAEIVKEKDNLQEINEQLLNMITERELENEELQEKLGNNENQMKEEIKRYEKIIKDLEDENEHNKIEFDKNIEDIMQEYNKYKDKMDDNLNEFKRIQDELKDEIEKKEEMLK